MPFVRFDNCYIDQMNTIESPCILVCVIEQNSGYCYGCGRTSSEIANWTNMSATGRRSLMMDLPSRVASLERKPRRATKRRRMAAQRASEPTKDKEQD